MSQKILDRLNIYGPLLCGCSIYFFFKQDAVLKQIEELVPLFGFLREIFFIEFSPKTAFGTFFMNHLCDVLWAYSLTWSCILATKKLFCGVILALFICAVNEFAQLSPYICATFDWLDLFYESLASGLSVILFDKIRR